MQIDRSSLFADCRLFGAGYTFDLVVGLTGLGCNAEPFQNGLGPEKSKNFFAHISRVVDSEAQHHTVR